jgi:hypothetical protein
MLTSELHRNQCGRELLLNEREGLLPLDTYYAAGIAPIGLAGFSVEIDKLIPWLLPRP